MPEALQVSDWHKLQHIPNISVGHPSKDYEEWMAKLERESIISNIRSNAQVIRAAYLFKRLAGLSTDDNAD